MSKKQIKLAITIAGGVSMGSYEAGVLTEIMHTLDYLNTNSNNEEYIIDVLTGSSAGALTSALTARIMMHNYHALKRNLHKAWVEQIDITELMKYSEPNCILSKQIIFDITDKCIIKPECETVAPANFAPDKLYLSFGLTNMCGVDYSIKYKQPDNRVIKNNNNQTGYLTTTFFSEKAEFTIEKNQPLETINWEEMRNCAVASGNFPVAFKPQPLKRSPKNYPGADQNKLKPEMSFLDGGIFNNEPVGEAIRLAQKADGGTIDENRIFILIDPNLNQSYVQHIDPNGPLADHCKRLITIVFAESNAKDWLKAQKVENKINWNTKLVGCIESLLKQDATTITTDQLNDFKNLSLEIYHQKKELFPGRYSEFSAKEFISMSTEKYSAVVENLKNSNKKEFLTNILFIIDNISGLRNKQTLNLHLISVNNNDVAGEMFCAFGGFFNHEWRYFDFKKGRINTHEQLKEILNTNQISKDRNEDGSSHIDYNISIEDESLSEAKLSEASKETRFKFKKLLYDKLNILITDITTSMLPAYIKLIVKLYLLPARLLLKGLLYTDKLMGF